MTEAFNENGLLSHPLVILLLRGIKERERDSRRADPPVG